MKEFEYKCSGGNGDYYEGTIKANSIEDTDSQLTVRYHNILKLEEKQI